jgi:hypothetical protein
MLPSFSIFELMTEEAFNRGGEWLFQYDELERAGELQKEFKAKTTKEAIQALKPFLEQYFTERNVEQVIEITLAPPKVKILSAEGAQFILASKALRGNPQSGKRFEDLVACQLSRKLTGQVMSVGYRQRNGVPKFRAALKDLGIDLSGVTHLKDGGLDVIWLPPLGKKSEIPFLNFQCKNTETIGDDVKGSVSDARKSFHSHHLFKPEDFLIFAVFNTYLDPKKVKDSKGRGCVYLGLPELLDCRNLTYPPVFI